MYQIVLIDQNNEIPVRQVRQGHQGRVPQKGEQLLVKWQGETRMCEVLDVWTNVILEGTPQQGAVQVLTRWSTGIDPKLYIRRFRA